VLAGWDRGFWRSPPGGVAELFDLAADAGMLVKPGPEYARDAGKALKK
jgi:hypothetical protein